MQLMDISPETERAFFTCLHLERPYDPLATIYRRRWFQRYESKGYKAQVLVLEDGCIVGKCHTIPVEHSPFVGEDLLAILCIYVHMYEHHIGDQRYKGYGRFMLEQVEIDARASGFKGIVTWALDWEVWNPVSFYEHMGYLRADQEGKVVAVWKPFSEEAKPPLLLRFDHPPMDCGEKVSVLVAGNSWCDNCYKRSVTREAIRGIEDLVKYVEAGYPCQERILHLGNIGGVFLDGDAYRPYELIGAPEDLREEIIRRYELKRNLHSSQHL